MDESVTGRDVDMISTLIEDLHSGGFLHVMCEDFKNLVTWAHSHSTICAHVPSPAEGYRLDEVNTFVLPFNCSAGHAYNWPVASLSGRVVEAKKVLSWTKKRKRGPLEAEEEKTELTEGAADLAAREEAPAELDDSQSSLFTNVSGEQDYGREQRDVPTPELPKVKTQKKKQRKKKRPSSYSTGMPREPALTSNASGTESGDFLNLPQILRLAETALQQIEHFAEDFAANVSAANVSALDDSSMHLEDLDSNADCASEEELMNQSQSGRGDSASTTPSRVQRGSQSEGHPSPVAGPSTSTSTSTASSSTKGKKTGAASKKVKGILGSVCSDLMNFEAWRASAYPSDSRLLCSLTVAELDALLATYLHYLWEGSHLQLTHHMLVQQARLLDRYLKLQSCFHSVQRSSELHVTHQSLEEYYQVLHERESDLHGAVICSVTLAEEEELRRLGVLGRHTPEALLHLVLYNNVRAFGPAHLYRMWPLPAGKFHPTRVVPTAGPGADADTDQPVLDCLEWVDLADPEQESLRMFQNTDDPLRCPLEDFRIYAAKHPGGFLGQNDAIYSNQRAGVDLKSSEWYSRAPMNKLHLDKAIGALAQRIETMRFTLSAMASV